MTIKSNIFKLVKKNDFKQIYKLIDNNKSFNVNIFNNNNISLLEICINANQIKEYVNDGGNLIAYRNSIKWVSNNIYEIELISNSLVAKDIDFDEREAFLDAQETGGAIFKSNIDKSHPINYGIESTSLPLFRNSNVYMTKDQQSYNNPILYTSDPLISGYVSEENLSLVKKSSPFKLVKRGKGKILLMTDNTNFRAFWFGTNRILLNMLFHSNIM